MSRQSAKTSRRRNWTPSLRTKVLKFYDAHSHGETIQKFRISSGQLHHWKKEREGPPPPHGGRRRHQGRGAPAQVQEAILFLEKAVAASVRENSTSIRTRIVHAMIVLALARLKGEEV